MLRVHVIATARSRRDAAEGHGVFGLLFGSAVRMAVSILSPVLGTGERGVALAVDFGASRRSRTRTATTFSPGASAKLARLRVAVVFFADAAVEPVALVDDLLMGGTARMKCSSGY